MIKKLFSLILALCTVFCLFSCEKTEEVGEFEFKIEGELPRIDEFSGSLGGTRFYKKYTPDFIPSDKYGRIIPYIGVGKEYYTESNNAGGRYHAYGFCTTDGKIVTDAAPNTSIHMTTTDDGFDFYNMSRTFANENGYDENYIQYIIPTDGSWMIEVPKYSYLCGWGDGVIAICTNAPGGHEKSSISLYDYDGNLTRRLEGYDNLTGFLNGYGSVMTYEEDYSIRQFIINTKGEIVLGPYRNAGRFTKEGVTNVKNLMEGCYLINTKGEKITAKVYDQLEAFTSLDYNQCYFIGRVGRGSSWDVYNSDGSFYKTIEAGNYINTRFLSDGEMIYGYPGGEDMIWRRLSDDSAIRNDEYDVGVTTLLGEGELYVNHNEEKGTAIVFDTDGRTVATLENVSYFGTSFGKYLTYYSGTVAFSDDVKLDTRKSYVYDTEKKEIVYEFPGGSYLNFVNDEKYLLATFNDDSSFIYNPTYSMYETESGEPVFDNATHIDSFTFDEKNYFRVCYKNSSYLYDENLKPILRCIAE